MDLPLIGTVDLTPSGLFLIVAVLVVVGYLGWQILEPRRSARRARTSDTALVESSNQFVDGVAAPDSEARDR